MSSFTLTFDFNRPGVLGLQKTHTPCFGARLIDPCQGGLTSTHLGPLHRPHRFTPGSSTQKLFEELMNLSLHQGIASPAHHLIGSYERQRGDVELLELFLGQIQALEL